MGDAAVEPSAPTCWVALIGADRVAPGEVIAVDVGDLELVVWRTLAGEAVVMDARCPHQWSHLEAEGVVDGDELVCTSHFWRFDGTGCGSKLSIKGRRDRKADIATFRCREREGVVEAALPRPDAGP